MADYVVYHKRTKMEYPALDVENLAAYTKKPVIGTIGSRVWLIAGEGRPCRYFLRAMFVVSGIGASDKPEFVSRITGTDGQLFDPMPELTDQSWFPTFVEQQGRFAFGFNPIRSVAAEAGLRAILLANTLR